MTPYDYWIRTIPQYYKTMALDGHTPEDILTAFRYQMMADAEERQEDKEMVIR